MAPQQRHVSKIGFPCEVENIPENRNRAESSIERDIARDPHQGRARRAQTDRFYENPPGKNGAGSIADAGNQSNEWVEPESQLSAGDSDPGIEQHRESPECGESTR